jgi:hypothetical protein
VVPPVTLFAVLHLNAMDDTVAFRRLLLLPLGLNLLFNAGQDALDTTEESVIRGITEGQEKLDTAYRPLEGARRGCLCTLPDALRRFPSRFLVNMTITLRGLIHALIDTPQKLYGQEVFAPFAPLLGVLAGAFRGDLVGVTARLDRGRAVLMQGHVAGQDDVHGLGKALD